MAEQVVGTVNDLSTLSALLKLTGLVEAFAGLRGTLFAVSASNILHYKLPAIPFVRVLCRFLDRVPSSPLTSCRIASEILPECTAPGADPQERLPQHI